MRWHYFPFEELNLATVADALSKVNVLDLAGRPVRLSPLWRDRTALLVFARHFGCNFCHEQISELKPRFNELRRANVAIAIIGTGSPSSAELFRNWLSLDVPIYSDEGRASYRAGGFKRSALRLLHPMGGVRLIDSLWKGYRISKVDGDFVQLGGAMVIRADGSVPYHQISAHPGDLPLAAEIVIAALRNSSPNTE
jgi:peroxiredoxin